MPYKDPIKLRQYKLDWQRKRRELFTEEEKEVLRERYRKYDAKRGSRKEYYRKRSRENFWKYKLMYAASKFGPNVYKVFERDRYRCTSCKKGRDDSVKLHIHHIDGKGSTHPKDERNNSTENMTVLCASCHTKIEMVVNPHRREHCRTLVLHRYRKSH